MDHPADPDTMIEVQPSKFTDEDAQGATRLPQRPVWSVRKHSRTNQRIPRQTHPGERSGDRHPKEKRG